MIWASRFAGSFAAHSRRAIRSITRAVLRTVAGGSATIPLALRTMRTFGAPSAQRAPSVRNFLIFFINFGSHHNDIKLMQ